MLGNTSGKVRGTSGIVTDIEVMFVMRRSRDGIV